jgi:hypothetical protein
MIDQFGRMIPAADVRGMTSPVRCARCRGVYDMGRVTIASRYVDCTTWRTPCCDQLVDDRADYVRLDRDGYEVRR